MDKIPNTASEEHKAPNPPMQPESHAHESSTKKSKSKIVLLIAIVVILVLGLAWWYFQSQFQKVSPVKDVSSTPVAKITKLVVGTDATYQPMEYVAPDGAIVGYDIDLGNAIAAELGAKIEYKNIPWDDVFKALENKQIDMIISSVSITDERKQKYDFSDNYLNAGQVIITRKDNTTIVSAETLRGKKIGVQQDTTEEAKALDYTSKNLVTSYPDSNQAVKALVDGHIDAQITDLPGAIDIVTKNSRLKIASDPITNEYYGIVFRKNDPNVTKINEALTSLRKKGVLTDLLTKYLKPRP